jgi:hypothetical protein
VTANELESSRSRCVTGRRLRRSDAATGCRDGLARPCAPSTRWPSWLRSVAHSFGVTEVKPEPDAVGAVVHDGQATGQGEAQSGGDVADTGLLVGRESGVECERDDRNDLLAAERLHGATGRDGLVAETGTDVLGEVFVGEGCGGGHVMTVNHVAVLVNKVSGESLETQKDATT